MILDASTLFFVKEREYLPTDQAALTEAMIKLRFEVSLEVRSAVFLQEGVILPPKTICLVRLSDLTRELRDLVLPAALYSSSFNEIDLVTPKFAVLPGPTHKVPVSDEPLIEWIPWELRTQQGLMSVAALLNLWRTAFDQSYLKLDTDRRELALKGLRRPR